jgi:tRNA A37 methylthiotransferase MiaB
MAGNTSERKYKVKFETLGCKLNFAETATIEKTVVTARHHARP